MDLSGLVGRIAGLDTELRRAAVGSVNRMLTARNWLVGCHIVEYEQGGEDRARYGAAVLRGLSDGLKHAGVRGMSLANLRNFRQFYLEYPRLRGPVVETSAGVELPARIRQQAAGELGTLPQVTVPQGDTEPELSPDPMALLRHFSFTHFVELMRIDDPLKRAFYETEGIRGNWSVPQLRRQIGSLLYERTGLSRDKTGLVEAVHGEGAVVTIEDAIRDPYVLEFTGLPEHYRYSESDLETALLDHVQAFLLELGNGFCFEARQKRISLDNEHDYVDLVFYHRILRCHVLVDLKVRKFTHGDAGQMNFYLNYYRDRVMCEGDNPPVGLILCTHRDETRVEYATAGMDNRLFVSKYLTALPSEETLRGFLRDDRDRTEHILREQQAEYRP